MIAAGDWLAPILDGRPWLEKPPLLHWLIIPLARALRRRDRAGRAAPLGAGGDPARPGRGDARGPAIRAEHRRPLRLRPGDDGLVRASAAGSPRPTCSWPASSPGRSSALDALRRASLDPPPYLPRKGGGCGSGPLPLAGQGRVGGQSPRWLARLFLLGLGLTALAKGIGFGAALILAAIGDRPPLGPRPENPPIPARSAGPRPRRGRRAGVAGAGPAPVSVGAGALDVARRRPIRRASRGLRRPVVVVGVWPGRRSA